MGKLAVFSYKAVQNKNRDAGTLFARKHKEFYIEPKPRPQAGSKKVGGLAAEWTGL